jgi:hypothetical protein
MTWCVRPPSRAFLAKWLTVGFASVVTAAGIWAYATHTHEEFFDSELASRVNGVCADTYANLGSPPPLPPSPSFEDRARRVELLTEGLREMIGDLRSLEAPGANDTFDRWLETWREFVAAGEAYADAIRTRDPSVYEPAGNVADPLAIELNEVARANGMDACVF